jgi:hypothetical protein
MNQYSMLPARTDQSKPWPSFRASRNDDDGYERRSRCHVSPRDPTRSATHGHSGTTFVLTTSGTLIGCYVGQQFGRFAEVAAGVALVLIGTAILIEHLTA